MKRSESREQAFIILFEYSFSGGSVAEIIEHAVDGKTVDIDSFTYKLANTCIQNISEIDEYINKYSVKWKIGRLPKTTLAILRLALSEIKYIEDVPNSVSANEAVELAKKYSTEEDASYINGIIGAFIKEVTIK